MSHLTAYSFSYYLFLFVCLFTEFLDGLYFLLPDISLLTTYTLYPFFFSFLFSTECFDGLNLPLPGISHLTAYPFFYYFLYYFLGLT